MTYEQTERTLGWLLAQYKAGTIDAEQLGLATIAAAGGWDLWTRTGFYARMEHHSGAHMCALWAECEHGCRGEQVRKDLACKWYAPFPRPVRDAA